MSELRHDPIQKRWVIVATERGDRPSDFKRRHAPPPGGTFCPFCEGNESKTPPEIYALRPGGGPPNTPGWFVRVVPNKFPALGIEGLPERRAVGIFDRMHGIGAHEVVIETTDHESDLADLPETQVLRVLDVYQERLRDLKRDPRFKYILLFKNHGHEAGASLAHPHAQIIATPVTPRVVAVELETAKAHFQVKERCLFCDVIEQEVASGERVVALDDQFVAIAPYASRFPFELFLAPRRHGHTFADVTPEELRGLARILREVLQRLKLGLDGPPYNFVLHDSPNSEVQPRRSHYWDTLAYDFHWHIEILPRLAAVAGFEWGTGFYINSTSPEAAARYLREVALDGSAG